MKTKCTYRATLVAAVIKCQLCAKCFMCYAYCSNKEAETQRSREFAPWQPGG